MMRKFSFVFCLAVFLAAFVSCSQKELGTIDKDGLADNVTVDGIPFIATFEQAEAGTDSRTIMEGRDSHTIVWCKGDEIRVWDENLNAGCFSAFQDGMSTRFVKSQVERGFNSSTATYAFYPASSVQSIDGGCIKFVISDRQTYLENSFASGANYAVSKVLTKYDAGSGNTMYKELPFTNVAGLLRLKLSCSSATQQVNVSRIVLKDLSQNICGTFSVDASQEKPAAQYVENGGNTITLDCGTDGIDLSTNPDRPTFFYFVLPQGAIAKNSGFTAEVYNKYGHLVTVLKTSNTAGTSTISRSNITTMQSRTCSWLPLNCREYDYLQSHFETDKTSGIIKGQIINTGVDISGGIRIRMRGTMDDAATAAGASGNPAFCGLVNPSGTAPWISIDYSADMSGVRACANGNSQYSTPVTGIGDMVDCDVRFFSGSGKFSGRINGTEFSSSIESGSLPSGNNFFLFAEGRVGDDGKAFAENISACSIYSFEMYDADDNLVRNFIPVACDEGNGMWDMVEGKFYGPYTENAFNAGQLTPEYTDIHIIPEIDPTLVINEFEIEGGEVLDFDTKNLEISIIMPYGTDLTNLVPTFSTNATSVWVDSRQQQSGVTAVDFSDKVTYHLRTRTGYNDWTVSVVTAEPGGINKYLKFTSFNIPDNGGVVSVDGNTVKIVVKSSSNRSSLVPVFTTNATKVYVNNVEQTSGVTANNFSGDVVYRLESKTGHNDITVKTWQFTISSMFVTTQIPTEQITKDDWVKKTAVLLFDNNTGIVDTLGVPSGADKINVNQIKGRGNSTWGFPKKPYTIKLDKKASILGMPADKRWNLLANWMDRTDLRNDIALELARRSPGLKWTSHGEFVELVMNEVHYGNFYLCEHIKIAPDRVNITAYDEDAPAAVNEIGYLLEFDTNYDEVNKFITSKGLPVNIKDPDAEGLTDYVTYINAWVNAIETKLNTSATSDYRDYLDIDSYIDWYLVHEMTNIYEPNHPKSTYMYKDAESAVDNKIHAGPCWDFDYDTFNANRSTNWSLRDDTKNGIWKWYKHLFADPVFVARLKAKWNAQKANYRNVANSYIAARAASIKFSVAMDKDIWPCTSEVNGDKDLSFDDAVARLKQYLNTKIDWMDSQIANM